MTSKHAPNPPGDGDSDRVARAGRRGRARVGSVPSSSPEMSARLSAAERAGIGAEALALTAHIDPYALSGRERVRYATLLTKVRNWLQARELDAADAVWQAYEIVDAGAARSESDRPEHDPASNFCTAKDGARMELAGACRISQHSAGVTLDVVEALATDEHGYRSLLDAGRTTVAHVQALVSMTQKVRDTAPDLLMETWGRVRDDAQRLPLGKFRRRLAAVIAEVLAPFTAKDHDSAMEEFVNVTVCPLPNGLAEMHVIGDAISIYSMYASINWLADHALGRNVDSTGSTGGTDSGDRGSNGLPFLGTDSEGFVTSRDAGDRGPSTNDDSAVHNGKSPQVTLSDLALRQRRWIAMRDAVLNATCTPSAGPAIELQIAVPIDVVLGRGEGVAHLPGYGSLTVSQLREQIADSPWRRILTDPITGEALDRHPDRYRPSSSLKAFTAAKFATCTAPGCSMPSKRLDWDHITPHDPETGRGPTVRSNGHPVSRRCHNLKTHNGWSVTNDNGPVWHSPLGSSYPHVATPFLPAHAPAHETGLASNPVPLDTFDTTITGSAAAA